uniref:Uncharacterized protein n=1 Tax=Plectus sambesii TaxID=2011161 RepID=A0A914VJS7_9BILA
MFSAEFLSQASDGTWRRAAGEVGPMEQQGDECWR